MSLQIIINCGMILLGAAVMLLCIFKAQALSAVMPLIPERQRKPVRLQLLLHQGLMVFFFFGYLIVLAAFAFDYELVSDTFVSVIFLFGAIFVLIGLTLQFRLLTEVQNTLHGILPICSYCKKIRSKEKCSEGPATWERIDDYISQKTAIDFSHGYCPECYQREMKKLRPDT